MSYLIVVLALIVLVVVHELGHFLAARAVGIRATKFYVFFPPALVKKQIGDVEYGIGAIPAGGFVKLPGMFEPDARELSERLAVDLEPVGPIGGTRGLEAQAARRRVTTAADADSLAAALRELDETLAAEQDERAGQAEHVSLRALSRARTRIGAALDDLHPSAYWRAALWRRMTVIFAGPAVNLVVAFVVLTAFYWWFVPVSVVSGPIPIRDVDRGSPAAIAGLEKGDRIVGWNGPIVGLDYDDYARRFIASRGKPVTVTWEDESAGGARSTRTLFPADIDGAARVGLLQGPITTRIDRHLTTGPGIATRTAWAEIRAVTWGNLTSLPQVFFDRDVRKEVGSVVGIVDVAQDVDEAGMVLRYVGVISLVLAVMNLLPLLPLDGGHLLFGLFEAARRRPLPRAVFERYSMVGLALVLTLFFIGLDNDLGRMSG